MVLVQRCRGYAHPDMRSLAGSEASPDYVDPAVYLTSLPVPAEPLEHTTPALAADGIRDFIALRHAVRDRLQAVEGPRDTIEDFLLAVDEIASNAVRHDQPPVGLRLWVAPGRLVCTVTDGGAGWSDPFAGYGPAHGADLSAGGMGLWLARQVCDHVALRHDGDGASVRLTTHWS